MELSIIILAKTDSQLSYTTTMNCINSFFSSEEDIDAEIIVVESNKKYEETYKFPENVNVIIPNEYFGFHKFLNYGIKASKGKYVALCNNDLLFQNNWFSEILKVANENPQLKSFSPIDDRFEVGKFKEPYQIGYKVQQQIKGWCLIAKKEIFKKTGLLDESFKFYYSDNDYALTLLYYGIQHVVVPTSHVQHLHKVATKEGEQKKETFFTKVNINQKIPKYLHAKTYSWILENPRVLFDHLTYYNKWGKPDSMYRIARYAEKLNKLNLNFVSRLLLFTKRKLKV